MSTTPLAWSSGPRARWRRRAVLRRPPAWFAWLTLAVFVLLVLFGPVLVTTDPLAQNFAPLLPIGSPGHLLGTDEDRKSTRLNSSHI